jgi:5-methylthioadenosine/S-adenosylhomocysteine deaminase
MILRPFEASIAIRAGWVLGFKDNSHVLIPDGVVAWKGAEITYVGQEPPTNGELIEAPGKLIIPGLISTHAHVGIHAGDRSIVDGGRDDFLSNGRLNYLARPPGPPRSPSSHAAAAAAARFGVACLLKSGVTTVVDVGASTVVEAEAVIAAAADSGIRLYSGPALTSGGYAYDEFGGAIVNLRRGEERQLVALAEEFARKHHRSHDDRIRSAVVVDEMFTSTPELIVAAKDLADRLGLIFTLHLAEQLFAFHEILRTTGHTPVGTLDRMGVLGANVVLGQPVYMSGHSHTGYPYRGDLEAISRSGSTIAHAPLIWSRRGIILEDFRRCQETGINLAIGTDTYPQDILLEMQLASVLGKVATLDHEAAPARDIFNAATVNGAKALGRPDLGRLAEGAKADLVVVNLLHPRIGPFFDPIRALIHCGHSDLIEDVIVDGKWVVREGRIGFENEGQLLADAKHHARLVWEEIEALSPNPQQHRAFKGAFGTLEGPFQPHVRD